jgi:hypothetical protein
MLAPREKQGRRGTTTTSLVLAKPAHQVLADSLQALPVKASSQRGGAGSRGCGDQARRLPTAHFRFHAGGAISPATAAGSEAFSIDSADAKSSSRDIAPAGGDRAAVCICPGVVMVVGDRSVAAGLDPDASFSERKHKSGLKPSLHLGLAGSMWDHAPVAGLATAPLARPTIVRVGPALRTLTLGWIALPAW